MTSEEVNQLQALLNKAHTLQRKIALARDAHKLLGTDAPMQMSVGDGQWPVPIHLTAEEERPIRYAVHQAIHRQLLKAQEELDRLEG